MPFVAVLTCSFFSACLCFCPGPTNSLFSLDSLFSLWIQFTERSFFYLPPHNVHPLALVLSLWSHSEQIGLFLLLSSYLYSQESGDSSPVPWVLPCAGCISTVHSAIFHVTVLCTLFIWLLFLWTCFSFTSVFLKGTQQSWRMPLSSLTGLPWWLRG